ncbi:hypothetical protein [Micropruina sp.]|uniref:hypothetical protein n=1 Tax=Micropruina sp. TaxID=2737536 RepID=UPI0039E666F3
MADTRTFNPAINAVGEAIRAALGEDVRPVLPGETPAPTSRKTDEATPPVTTVRTFTFGTTAKKPE